MTRSVDSSKKKMLVHMCCGPCSIYPLKRILEEKYHVVGFFYNPNIHPEDEFRKRLDAVKRLSELMEVEVILFEDYMPQPFFEGVSRGEDKNSRCMHCYTIRLDKTAEVAKGLGFDCFSSSLLYSKYQAHHLITGIGMELSERYTIPFYYEDFRAGWRRGIEESRRMSLYRQRYCGCIFSKIERGI